MQTSVEKRGKPRFAVRYPAWFSEAQNEGCYAFVTDISWGGLFLSALKLREVGTPLNIRVTLRGSQEPLDLRGQVAWVTRFPPKGPGMGVKLDLDQAGFFTSSNDERVD